MALLELLAMLAAWKWVACTKEICYPCPFPCPYRLSDTHKLVPQTKEILHCLSPYPYRLWGMQVHVMDTRTKELIHHPSPCCSLGMQAELQAARTSENHRKELLRRSAPFFLNTPSSLNIPSSLNTPFFLNKQVNPTMQAESGSHRKEHLILLHRTSFCRKRDPQPNSLCEEIRS